MINARSNTLKLGWREFGLDSSKSCKLCGAEVETLQHFLIDCPRLQFVRDEHIQLQRPFIERKNDIMALMLLLNVNEENDYYIEILRKLWRERKKIILENQESPLGI